MDFSANPVCFDLSGDFSQDPFKELAFISLTLLRRVRIGRKEDFGKNIFKANVLATATWQGIII